MQYKLKIRAEKNIILPFQYSNILQAIVLSMLEDDVYRKFVHDEGFQYEKRSFKLYTYSRLIGRAKVNRTSKTFNFGEHCTLYLASMDEKFLSNILNGFLEAGRTISFGGNKAMIENMEGIQCVDKNEIFTTLSPITTYSTLYDKEGGKHIYYYNPFEKEFSKNITENLKKKYYSFYNKMPENDFFEIFPGDKVKECALVYKGKLVKGWTGDFICHGSDEMMEVALSAGVGSRNSQGFGMIIQR